jgi:hypothetical protein
MIEKTKPDAEKLEKDIAYAVQCGDNEAVNKLLDKGDNINLKDLVHNKKYPFIMFYSYYSLYYRTHTQTLSLFIYLYCVKIIHHRWVPHWCM